VERVMARLFDVHDPLPASKPQLTALAARLTPDTRPGDYAQAVMDLGATICSPRNPACGICPLVTRCAAHAAGTAALLPKKTPKKKTPTRYGIAYVVRRPDGSWLLETRPESGLLGGMLGFPTTDWCDVPTPAPPVATDWQILNSVAKHTFTHFHLELTIMTAITDAVPTRGHYVGRDDFDPSTLPTAMRKVHAQIAATLRHD